MKGLKLCAMLSLMLWITTVPVILAAPENDPIASAVELPPSGPATLGSNAGGTLEAGEPIPEGFNTSSYSATSWWNLELAASDATWYEVTTAGSAFDTVLAVWTGVNYASPLVLVHANDESAEGNASRLRFLASPDVVYKVSVAGRGAGQQGDIAVRATSAVEEPFALIRSGTLTPASPNVTSANASITVTLNMTARREIASGLFTLYNPTGVPVLTRPFSGAGNRISGNVAEGAYEIKAVLPQGSVPGTYRWNLHLVSAGSFPSAISYGWEGLAPLPAGATRTLNVQNTAPVNTYAAWAESNSLIGTEADPEDDFDQDGYTNLTEFAFGLDPQNPFPSHLRIASGQLVQPGLPNVTCVGTGSQRRLRVEHVRRIGESSLAYTVQFSSDLITWANATQPAVTLTSNGVFEAVAVEDVASNPVRTRRYARVRAVR